MRLSKFVVNCSTFSVNSGYVILHSTVIVTRVEFIKQSREINKTMNNNLFEGSDDDGEDLQLSTNKDYAKTYNILRKKELLQKCKFRIRYCDHLPFVNYIT